jgi:hypothetical protein
MTEQTPTLLSDYLAEALHQLNLARKEVQRAHLRHPEAALHAIAEAEKDISHVVGLIAGARQ